MKLLILFLITAMAFTGCSTTTKEASYKQITPDEAASMLETETGYILLDVRTAEEYEEKHIPGAVNIPNETIGAEEIPELSDKDQLILIY